MRLKLERSVKRRCYNFAGSFCAKKMLFYEGWAEARPLIQLLVMAKVTIINLSLLDTTCVGPWFLTLILCFWDGCGALVVLEEDEEDTRVM